MADTELLLLGNRSWSWLYLPDLSECNHVTKNCHLSWRKGQISPQRCCLIILKANYNRFFISHLCPCIKSFKHNFSVTPFITLHYGNILLKNHIRLYELLVFLNKYLENDSRKNVLSKAVFYLEGWHFLSVPKINWFGEMAFHSLSRKVQGFM